MHKVQAVCTKFLCTDRRYEKPSYFTRTVLPTQVEHFVCHFVQKLCKPHGILFLRAASLEELRAELPRMELEHRVTVEKNSSAVPKGSQAEVCVCERESEESIRLSC